MLGTLQMACLLRRSSLLLLVCPLFMTVFPTRPMPLSVPRPPSNPPPPPLKRTLHKVGAYLKCTEHTRHSALRVGGQVRGSLPWRRWGRPCLRASARDMNQRTVRAPER